MKDKLSPNNFVLYAMKMYSNPLCTGIDEFKEDIMRVKYIKRLLLKYKNNGELRERLILNHLIYYKMCSVLKRVQESFFISYQKNYIPILKLF